MWISVKCPYHNDEHNSATLNVVTGEFYCFACHKHAKKEETQEFFGEILAGGSNKEHLEKVRKRMQEFNKIMEQYHKLEMKYHPYLRHRGVTEDQMYEFGIKVSPQGIFFPLIKSGRFIGVHMRQFSGLPKYLTITKEPKMIWPDMPTDNVFILTEGVFGALRLRRFGYNAYAMLGAGLSNAQVNMLKSAMTYADNIYAFFDPDPPGIKTMKKLAKYGIIPLYNGVSVADEVLSQEEIEDLINNASIYQFLKEVSHE